MTGLVEEIQRDALNSQVAVSTILRKVKAAAAKLSLGPVVGWVESELNGYTGELPNYRKLHGRPQALNPYQGWIPIIMQTAEMNEELSRANISQSIASLEDLIANNPGGFVQFPYPPALIMALNESMDVEYGSMANHVSITQIVSIVDAVRNAALDWALELEKAGIVGEGFSFDSTEKSRAHSESVTYNIASIASFNGILGSGNTVGTLTITHANLESIRETVEKIKVALPELQKVGIDEKALARTLNEIEGETRTSEPNAGKLKSLLSSARDIVVGAAGNLTAEGTLSLLAVALKSLGG